MKYKAKNLVTKFGEDLIGRSINTEKFGDWPGGIASITEINPDPNAPEIAIQVSGPQGTIGIYEDEDVWLILGA